VSLGFRYQNFGSGLQKKAFRSGYIDEVIPQTAATLTLNPIFGHTSVSYTTAVWKDVTLSTRYDYNFHSYDSNFAVGMEVRKERKIIKTKFDSDKVSLWRLGGFESNFGSLPFFFFFFFLGSFCASAGRIWQSSSQLWNTAVTGPGGHPFSWNSR